MSTMKIRNRKRKIGENQGQSKNGLILTLIESRKASLLGFLFVFIRVYSWPNFLLFLSALRASVVGVAFGFDLGSLRV